MICIFYSKEHQGPLRYIIARNKIEVSVHRRDTILFYNSTICVMLLWLFTTILNITNLANYASVLQK